MNISKTVLKGYFLDNNKKDSQEKINFIKIKFQNKYRIQVFLFIVVKSSFFLTKKNKKFYKNKKRTNSNIKSDYLFDTFNFVKFFLNKLFPLTATFVILVSLTELSNFL
jgi:hypothetical protein